MVPPITIPAGPPITDLDSAISGSTASPLEDDDDDLHQNFISLLQYKDAYHILSIDKTSTPKAIVEAYETCKQQTEIALENCEKNESKTCGNGRTNSFFMSQKNYLELKLQALDQALGELLPEENEEGEDTAAAPCVLAEAVKDAPTTVEAARVQTKNPQTINRTVPPIREETSDDELDTIDIYFRPNPSARPQQQHQQLPSAKNNGQHFHIRSKSPSDHSIDVSSVSWEESVFSKKEEASEGGLSDVLGPLNGKATRAASPASAAKGKLPPLIATRNNGYSRPPTGINGRPRPMPQVSPRSVTDFPPSIQRNQYFDMVEEDNGKSFVGKGRLRGSPRYAHNANNNSHVYLTSADATEAARKGVLRALSEDDSECAPFDDDNEHLHMVRANLVKSLNISNFTVDPTADGVSSSLERTRSDGDAVASRPFAGKTDRMPKETNSIMDSEYSGELNHREPPGAYGGTNPSPTKTKPVPSENNRKSSSSVASSKQDSKKSYNSSRRRSSSNDNRAVSRRSRRHDEEVYYDYDYENIIQSSIELADEMCVAMQSCWNNVMSEAAGGECTRVRRDDYQRSNSESQSSAANVSRSDGESDGDEDTAFYTRDTYTEGESTAFDTQTSFSREQRSSPNTSLLRKNYPKKKMLV